MIRRSGNFGFVDNGAGEIYSFSMASGGAGWSPSTFLIRGGIGTFGTKYINVNGIPVIPFGHDNNLPGRVRELLEKFYAGEGIMGKKAGLQWGEGPRLYVDAVDANNIFYRQWIIDDKIQADLKSTDYISQMHRCLIDMCHLEGFWVKFTRTRGTRIGAGKIAKVEHVPAEKVRFVWAGDGVPPTHAMVADWPVVDSQTSKVYPLFDPENPLKHPVSLAYYNIYSYHLILRDQDEHAASGSSSVQLSQNKVSAAQEAEKTETHVEATIPLELKIGVALIVIFLLYLCYKRFKPWIKLILP